MSRRATRLTEADKTDIVNRLVKATQTQSPAENRSTKSVVTTVDSPQWGQLDPVSARIRTRADLAREYVVAQMNALPNFLRTLPSAFDDLTCDFGIDAYRRMMQDNEVNAAVSVLKLAVAAQDASITPCVDPEDKRYEEAKRYAEFFQRELLRLPRPFNQTLEEILDAIVEGSSVTEVTTDLIEMGEDAGMIGITGLSKKPLENTRFLTDPFNNVVGVVPLRIGQHIPYRNIIPLDMSGKIVDADWVLRRDKFVVFTNEPPSNDPRGRSILRSAYAAWYAKECVLKAWLEFVGFAGNPILVATAGENAGDICIVDPISGEKKMYQATEFLSMLLNDAKSGARLAMPYGSKIEFVTTSNIGAAFEKFIAWCDRAIVRAILHQHLATGEGEHDARAAAVVHKDTLSLIIMRLKNRVSATIREDLFKPLMRRNFGDESVLLTPFLDLGDGDGFPPKLDEIMKFIQIAPPDSIDWKLLRDKFKLPINEDYAPEKKQDGVNPLQPKDDDSAKDKNAELPGIPADQSMKDEAQKIVGGEQ